MKITLKARFADERRMERKIKTQDDIDAACRDFTSRNINALAAPLAELLNAPNYDCEFYQVDASIEVSYFPIRKGYFTTAVLWDIYEASDIVDAGRELRYYLRGLLRSHAEIVDRLEQGRLAA